MALEWALREAVKIMGRSLDRLDKHSKRQVQQVCAESTVFLVEVQATLQNQTPENIGGIRHRATAWLVLFRSTTLRSTG
jgi:hypothetical protein